MLAMARARGGSGCAHRPAQFLPSGLPLQDACALSPSPLVAGSAAQGSGRRGGRRSQVRVVRGRRRYCGHGRRPASPVTTLATRRCHRIPAPRSFPFLARPWSGTAPCAWSGGDGQGPRAPGHGRQQPRSRERTTPATGNLEPQPTKPRPGPEGQQPGRYPLRRGDRERGAFNLGRYDVDLLGTECTHASAPRRFPHCPGRHFQPNMGRHLRRDPAQSRHADLRADRG